MSKKLDEIMIARGISISGVLIIHVTSLSSVELRIDSSMHLLYLAINKAANFSVPAFLFLSGLVLFYRYNNFTNLRDVLFFYKRRIKYLFIPYIIWSVFYLVVDDNTVKNFSIYLFIKHLIQGNAEYHLYFVPLIAQFYVLFPLILFLFNKISKRNPCLLLYIVVVSGIIIQIVMGIMNYKFQWVSDKSILCSTYFLSFSLGGYIGYYYNDCLLFMFKKRNYLLIAVALFLVSHVILSILSSLLWNINAFFKESIVQVFCILTAINLITIGRDINENGNKVIRDLLYKFGANSFGIYLVHPIFLSIYGHYVNFPANSPFYHLNIVAKAILTFVLPLVFVLSLRKWKYYWVIIGKS